MKYVYVFTLRHASWNCAVLLDYHGPELN